MTIPGFSGYLVTQAYLASSDSSSVVDAGLQAAMRKWSATSGDLLGRIGPATPPRAIFEVVGRPLVESLGFVEVGSPESSGQVLLVDLTSTGRIVLLLVAPWRERLDGHWRRAVVEARRRRACWCILFNGDSIRIVDPGRLYARRFVQIDLRFAIDRQAARDVLARLAAARSLCVDPSDAGSLHALVAASDRHASAVCRSLRDGVLSASAAVVRALVERRKWSPPLGLEDAFEQALTIVYRILFLLFAEARALVPLWHPLYRASYSIESLRDAAERSPHATGLWDALRAIGRLAHAGCRAGDLHVPPFNGRLFSPSRTPLAERRDLDNRAAAHAIVSLSTRPSPDRAGRERIVYRDLGVEQLGAVYETLLDYRPRLVPSGPPRDGRSSGNVVLETGSGIRKSTGTFYTPQPLAEYLIRRTLGPLVHDAAPADILRLRIVDPAMGSGAFLVAACRYLAAAYEEALVAHGDCHPADVDEAERTSFRRLIAERCLYGVDVNPMAVQLARLSLWLTTLAADRPLTFLDHRLLAGDSVLGARLSDLRHAPVLERRSGRAASLPLFGSDPAIEALRGALPIRFSIETTPNDTLSQVRTKERALAALGSRDGPLSRWKRIGDLWCAAWFAGADGATLATAFASLADVLLGGSGALPNRIASALLERADRIAAARRFFHWELEFPEVFFDEHGRRLVHGGFDAVIGNPPWDMMRADSGDGDDRNTARPTLAAAVRFSRDSGVYSAQSDGHANRYQLFVERASQLARAGGRIGLVLPSGLATDHGSAELRRMLITACAVDSMVGVDNQRGIFPIHRSVRFLLVSATSGTPTSRVACRFGVDSTAELESLAHEAAESAFPVHLSMATLERLSGPALSVPHLRTTLDLAICEKAAVSFPPLGASQGWNARFGRELNASDDRDAFRPSGHGLPIVDGKHLEPFRVLVDRSARSISAAEARRRISGERFSRPRLAYRDVAGAANRVTLIAAILPAGCVSTHTVFCLRSPLTRADQLLLCGLFNSLVVNYLVRLRVTTHVTTAVLERLPIPTRDQAPAACRSIAALARVLSRRTDPRARALLNARAAELYQLTRAEFEHILGTFPLIPKAERDAALEQFAARR